MTKSAMIRARVDSTLKEEAERYRDHPLIDNWRGRRECDIQPDWLLLYKLQDNGIIFERTGTHTDLFE